jgi:hypothetical protein
MENQLRISDLARQAGIVTSMIRYYEEIGLLPPAARTDNGYRGSTTKPTSNGYALSSGPRLWSFAWRR